MIGIVAIVLAAVYIPDSETSGTIILSTLGLVAIAAGVFALRTHRFGLRKRRGMAKVGITLGAIALVSSTIAFANVTWGTSIPTLADGTRWVTLAV